MRSPAIVLAASAAVLGLGVGTMGGKAMSPAPATRWVTVAARPDPQLANEVSALAATEARLAALPGNDAELKAVRSQLDALQHQTSSVTTVGVGQVLDTPDVLTLSVGVAAFRSTPSDALAAAATEANRIIAALENGGVAPRDIQTAFIGFGRAYPPQSGFAASNQLTAKLRSLTHAPAIIGAAADAGGSDAQGWAVTFSLQDNARQLAVARARAMADARAQAADFARLAGRTLGPVRTVTEGESATPGPVPGGASAQSAPAVPIQPGQQEIAVTVTVVYDLLA